MDRGIRKLYTSLSLVLTAAAVGCSSSDAQAPAPKKLEIYSWLTSGSEKGSLDLLLAEVKKVEPEIQITNAAQDRSEIAQMELPARISKGTPPDSWQQLPGLPLTPFFEANELASLDALAAEQNWAAVFPKAVLDASRKGGKLYSVPLNIERGNTLFYNKTVFDAPPATRYPDGTVEDFFRAANELQAKGIEKPLAVSDKGGWTVGAAVFDAILLAQAGTEFTEAYLTGAKSADAPEMRAALSTVLRMMSYSNDDRAQLGWGDAVGKVCDHSSGAPASTAAMLYLPDFVKGEFAHRACGSNEVGYVAVQPAGVKAFTFIGISWPLAAVAPNHDMALKFLTVAGSAPGQAAFNPTKGSIPARTDVPVSLDTGFDDISVQTAADFQAGQTGATKLILGWAASTPSDFQTAINDSLQAFADPSNANYGNVDAVMTVMSQYYSSLRKQ